LSKTIEAGLF